MWPPKTKKGRKRPSNPTEEVPHSAGLRPLSGYLPDAPVMCREYLWVPLLRQPWAPQALGTPYCRDKKGVGTQDNLQQGRGPCPHQSRVR